jgi:hypothetical protein
MERRRRPLRHLGMAAEARPAARHGAGAAGWRVTDDHRLNRRLRVPGRLRGGEVILAATRDRTGWEAEIRAA